jgi:cytochrome c oxidase subunit 3
MWIGLGGIVMYFMALTSSFIVRQGLSSDWVAVELPPLLWLNTGVLLLSSLTLVEARRFEKRGRETAFRRWWGLTTALGASFLVLQLVAWRQLAAAGVYLASNPASSFFYLLTASHGLHLLGGILALLYLAWRHRRRRLPSSAEEAAALYWHSMDGLWVYLFLLLLLGR